MRCASALSTLAETEAARRGVLERVAQGLAGEPADLALIFVSPHHADGLGRLAAEVRSRGLGRVVLGCTGETIVGDDWEIEGAPAVSLWSIRLSGARVQPLRLTFEDGEFTGWPDEPASSGPCPDSRAILLLGDPFSFPADHWLRALDERSPGLRAVGGMASAGGQPGVNRLVLGDEVYDDGAVAVLIEGPVSIRTVVSQGCRPIGRPMIITRADRNLIRELGRRPAVEAFRETYEGLTPDEQGLVREGLHVGQVINEYQESFRRGDFLIRNVMGADEAGGIAITDAVRVGQTVQFHVRDADTADEDLRTLLAEEATARPAGALLFSCNGRGTRLFPAPNHDVGVLREQLGPVPVAGFFAMGEIGPVGGKNFLHGFTASVALFEEASPGSGSAPT
jgi:small ligand-binding sensory domain FIST